MFYDATSFNKKLCWDVSGEDTFGMFYNSGGSIGCA